MRRLPERVGAVIEARGIRKAFGATQALAGVDVTAHAGRVLALLGPNGAGKTTFVWILATLLRADEGWGARGGSVCSEMRQRCGPLLCRAAPALARAARSGRDQPNLRKQPRPPRRERHAASHP